MTAKEKEMMNIIRKKNEKFIMTPEKAARLKRRLRKIVWSEQ